MVSLERIIEALSALTQSQGGFGTQKEAKEVVRHRDEVRAIRESFDSQKGNLREEARRQHEARFAPLRAVIDPLIPVMQALRDAYFPFRSIAVGDVYRKPWLLSERSSHYARGLIIPVQADDSRRIIYAIATCDHPGIENFLGIRMSKKYYLNIGEQDEYDTDGTAVFQNKTLWWARSRDQIVDMNVDYIPFFISMNPKGKGKIDFSSVNDFLPQLSDADLSRGIVVANPATFIAEHAGEVERRLSEVLAPWARRQLMIQASA